MNDFEKQVLQRIRDGMKRRKVTQMDLAKVLEVQQSSISRMLGGAPFPSLGQLKIIAEMLDMSLYYLIGLQEESYRELTVDAAKVADAYSDADPVIQLVIRRVLDIKDEEN